MATGQRDTEHEGLDREERGFDRGDERTSIDRAKRAVALVAGGALLIRGLRRRSLRGVATALVGGWLLSRALGGPANIRKRVRQSAPSAGADDRGGPVRVSRSVTVGRPADELYEVWRDPERLSRIVGHVADVAPAGEDRLEWTVSGPGGRDLSWVTAIVADEPGERLRWESAGGALVSNDGEVRFRDAGGDRGTVVTLTVGVDPPGGGLGTAALERLDALPEALVGTALDRFKALAESGEIPTLEGNPSGRGRGDRL